MRIHRSRIIAVLSGTALFLSAMPSYGAATVGSPDPSPDPNGADVSVISPTGPATRADQPAANPWRLRTRPGQVNPLQLQPLCDPSSSAPPVTLEFRLFDDVTVKPVTTLIERAPTGDTLNWRGTVPGDPESSVTLTAVNACHADGADTWLSATLNDRGKLYTVEATGPRQVRVSELDPGMYELGDPGEEFKPARHTSAPTGRSHAPTTPARPPLSSPAKQLRADGCQVATTPVIDILALYTPKAALEAGGDTQAETQIASAEPLANLALTNSAINARFRIVRIEKATGYTGSDDNTGLDAFRDGTAGVDARGLRDKYGADIVVLFTSGGSGVGYTPVLPDASTADSGFSLMNITYIPNSTMTHEIGHNMGADHDWVASDRTLNPAYPYDPGTARRRRGGARSWPTRRSATAACASPTSPTRTSATSARPPGPGTTSRSQADNAHILNLSAQTVSNYEPTQDPPLLCALNVSVDPAGGGTASTDVAGPYLSGTTVTARARPLPGYYFAGWTLDGKLYGSTPSVTVRSDSDKDLVARFAGPPSTQAVAPMRGEMVAAVNGRRFV